ncbi:MAG: CotH kinase family protein, partial [Bacteroidia bacterium]|nr:CotH kinase family protein [Bacteroidia bacterium]
MNSKKILYAVVILINIQRLFSQELYDINTIRTLYLNFYDPNWEYILDSLKDDDSDERVLADLIVDDIYYDSVGVRFKGNSSYNFTQEGDKRPMNIKLDFIKNYDLYGYNTLKIANMFKDPTCVREVMSYEMLQNYMPAPQSNYIKLYTGSDYRGLYTSIQDVDNDFLDLNYGSNDYSFFKCDPITITGTPEPPPPGCPPVQGISSPLIYMGEDTACYKQSYDIQSDSEEGWVRLLDLIRQLNLAPNLVSQNLDVDRALWMLVFNNIFVNMDSYTGSGHNYYIYENEYGRFNVMIWDLNENMGVFTMNLTVQQMQTMSTLYGQNDSLRPLIKKLMSIPEIKKKYYAHYRTMYNELVANDYYKTRANQLRTMLDTIVQNDPQFLYTYNDFLNSMNQNIGNIVGLNVLMDARKNHLSTHPVLSLQGPDISNIQYSP